MINDNMDGSFIDVGDDGPKQFTRIIATITVP